MINQLFNKPISDDLLKKVLNCFNLSGIEDSRMFSKYDMDMNECDAPESNKTEAGYVLIRSVPMRTPGSSSTPSAEMWFRRPRLTVVALAAGVEGAGAGAAVAGAFWGHSLE